MKKLFCLLLAALVTALLAVPSCATAPAVIGEAEVPALVIGGSLITNGQGFTRNIVCLSEADMERIVSAASGEATYCLGLGDCFSEPLLYSTYENHGTPTWIYRRVFGLDLAALAEALGIDTSKKLSISVTADDGMTYTLPDAFGTEEERITYDVSGAPAGRIGPVLALFETTTETYELGKGAVPPIPRLGADSPDRVNGVFGFGQTAVDDVNSCHWVKGVVRMRIGSEEAACVVTDSSGRPVYAPLSAIAAMGVRGAKLGSVSAEGLLLSDLLSGLSISVPQGYGVEAASATGEKLFISDPASAFAAWSATDGGRRIENSAALRLYMTDGRVLADVNAFSVVKAEDPVFNDLADFGWAEEAITALCEKGVVNGIGGGAFGPELTLTRAQLVTMLWRACGEPAAETASFEDIKAGEWYADAVAWAEESGVVKGYGNGKFGTNEPITTEQLATILYRFAGEPEIPSVALPENVSGWAEDAVAWALYEDLMPVLADGKTTPGAGATRAEAAVALYRALYVG
jgi:hypothetical protein